MFIKDRAYGSAIIKEPVLLGLLQSPSLLRLKNVSQFGIPDKYYNFKGYSRHEHSVGVILLLRKLGAGLEEQAAGLLHDVSVSAFSHIADWVFGNGREANESVHDSWHQNFVRKSEITAILKKHNFGWQRIVNEDNFSLLENNIPDLCADRVDYALREFALWLDASLVKKCLPGIINVNGRIVFVDKKSAWLFARGFLSLQNRHWGQVQAVRRYDLFSSLLKKALALKLVKRQEFFGKEDDIIKKLENSKDKEIKQGLSLLRKKQIPILQNKKVFKKFRHVDPKILVSNKLVRLSELDKKFKSLLEQQRRLNKKGVIV